MSHMMVTKNPQNVHRKCFWTILVTFIFDVKIDVNMCEPHYVNLFFLWTSSIVCVFDFLTFDNFLTNCHLFDILTSFNLNHLSPSQGYFSKFILHFELNVHWLIAHFHPHRSWIIIIISSSLLIIGFCLWVDWLSVYGASFGSSPCWCFLHSIMVLNCVVIHQVQPNMRCA